MNGQTSTDDPNWAAVCVEPPGERRGKRLPAVDRTTTSLNLDTFWAATQYLTVQVDIVPCDHLTSTELTLTAARTGAGPSP